MSMEMPQTPKPSEGGGDDLLSRIKMAREITTGIKNLAKGIEFGARMNRLLETMTNHPQEFTQSDFGELERAVKKVIEKEESQHDTNDVMQNLLTKLETLEERYKLSEKEE